MDKRKTASIVLSLIILITAVIAVCVMYFYINAEKDAQINKIAELEKNNANLQGVMDYLQEEVNAMLKTPDELQSKLDALSEELKTIYDADPDALDILATDLFYKGSLEIAKTQFWDYQQYQKFDPDDLPDWFEEENYEFEITIDGAVYEYRNELYSWPIEEYGKIFTGDMLEKVADQRFAEIDENLYVKKVDPNAVRWEAVNAELKRVSETDNEIKYSVKYDREENGKITDKGLTCTMTIKYEEGRYRISDTDFGNL